MTGPERYPARSLAATSASPPRRAARVLSGRIAASLLCTVLPAIAHGQTFSFQTIDDMTDPTFNQLLGINDNGVISGYFGSGAPGHPNQGYLTAPPYNSFTAFNVNGSVQTQATGLNNAGNVTGFWSDTNTGADANFGFLTTPAGSNTIFVDVNDPAVNGTPHQTQVLGINNNGVSAGFYNDSAGNVHGFTYALGTGAYVPVPVAGAVSLAATGINDNGQICGFFTNATGATSGFVRNSTGGMVTKFKVPKSNFTQLLGINNSGVAVGFYMAHKTTHGLYYTPATGAWTTVDAPNGTGGTVVNGINNRNQLVGFYTDTNGKTHGMMVTVTP